MATQGRPDPRRRGDSSRSFDWLGDAAEGAASESFDGDGDGASWMERWCARIDKGELGNLIRALGSRYFSVALLAIALVLVAAAWRYQDFALGIVAGIALFLALFVEGMRYIRFEYLKLPPEPIRKQADTLSAAASTQQLIKRIAFGSTDYPLRAPLQAICIRRDPATVELHVESLGTSLVGQGDTPDQAFVDWKEQFHIAYQRLYRKRPFEMTETERTQWAAFERALDVEAYTEQRPLVLRQLGWLRSTRPDPYGIGWLDNRQETVRLAEMPAEFASFHAGQWFEATVERDRRTLALHKVLYVQPIPPGQPMTPEQTAEFFAQRPLEHGTPAPVRDWTQR